MLGMKGNAQAVVAIAYGHNEPSFGDSQVRRELASVLRDISGLVGHAAMLQYMASLVQQGHQELLSLNSPGGDSGAVPSGGPQAQSGGAANLPPISSEGSRRQLPASLR